ncbi:hypothetical protein PYW08_013000 [Mythimna loreyi]|uniref:Uncharacterized protein n=1 Tax=Mythimna loreyi TaxID=667449 RepID=A0ACC2Q2D6_9NEOP|nr:hypothetical protein PYW08_013000 [Mythimna loreyi]
MPKISRTPPPNTSNQQAEVQSEPELTGHGDGISKNINTRKRMRLERTSGVSTQSKELSYDVTQFEELKSTILSWKADQDIILKKLVAYVTELKLQNQSIKDSNTEIIKSMNFMNKNYEDTRKKLDE